MLAFFSPERATVKLVDIGGKCNDRCKVSRKEWVRMAGPGGTEEGPLRRRSLLGDDRK